MTSRIKNWQRKKFRSFFTPSNCAIISTLRTIFEGVFIYEELFKIVRVFNCRISSKLSLERIVSFNSIQSKMFLFLVFFSRLQQMKMTEKSIYCTLNRTLKLKKSKDIDKKNGGSFEFTYFFIVDSLL